jgi:hypothetical protein
MSLVHINSQNEGVYSRQNEMQQLRNKILITGLVDLDLRQLTDTFQKTLFVITGHPQILPDGGVHLGYSRNCSFS